ncbi:MAG: AMP-binding protein, partial [Bacteroidaceae bacterium]|nr:AMP-binding protein [Bacteroidaceae bacterium]
VHPLSSEKELEYYIKIAESKYVLVIDAVFDKIYRLRDTAGLERIIVVRPSDGLGFLKKKLYNTLHIKKVRLPSNDSRVVLWEDFIANSYFYQGNYHEERGAEDLAVIMYSGGTTGAPKAVNLSLSAFHLPVFRLLFSVFCFPFISYPLPLRVCPTSHWGVLSSEGTE